jgi:murein L,D-transpeptidase YcbB/YkuD
MRQMQNGIVRDNVYLDRTRDNLLSKSANAIDCRRMVRPGMTGNPGERGAVYPLPKLRRGAARLTALVLTFAVGAAVVVLSPRQAAADPPAPPPIPTAAAPPPVDIAATPATLTPFAGDDGIEDRLDTAGRVIVAGERLHEHLVRRFYAAHGWKPVWDSRPAAAAALETEVRGGDRHGLDPSLFHGAVLREHLSAVEHELLLSDAILAYADALARGAVPVGERPDNEDLRPAPVDVVAVVDAATSAPDPGEAIEALAPTSPEYLALRRAYAEYVAIAIASSAARGGVGFGVHGRAAIIGVAEALRRARQVAINLERLRWLPREMPADRLVVDTTVAQLQLFRDDQPAFTTRVVAGEFDKQTPELQSVIKYVLFNPPWNIPPSIVRKEILPKLAGNRGYLAAHHMRWRGPMAVQQEAGPYSALGRIKFEMDDRFDVYLHDTPEKYRFQAADRMMSHGCVRVENPRELASLLLDETPEQIDKAIGVGRTHSRALPKAVPVFIVYRTAVAESDGSIAFRGDPYQRDSRLWAALNRGRDVSVAQRSDGLSANRAKKNPASSTVAEKTATIGD